tara:strand:- start:346 stop:1515 length:1170 start_codon:yes stop_codon:yes gene_type:complete
MSEIKVNSIKGVNSTDAAITINNSDGTCTANLSNRQNRNLIINGAMQVAQRSSSNIAASGYQTVDRFEVNLFGYASVPSQGQLDIASGTTPYTLGFRKSYRIQNGNQTQADSDAFIRFKTTLEAQDIANSGWNYVSSSSFITLSFWIKSTVAQNFYGRLQTVDGTSQNYSFETGSLTADTWTKVTKTIPGNSNLQFDNNNDAGLILEIAAWFGTDYTSSGVSLNTWAAYASGTRTPDQTSTWYLTNDAKLEITGVQLEVGSHASDFEFLSHADELRRCMRYFQQVTGDGINIGLGFYYTSSYLQIPYRFPVPMRTTPSVDDITGTHYYVIYRDGAADTFNSVTIDSGSNNKQVLFYNNSEVSGTAGQTGIVRCNNLAPNGGQIQFNAEL